MKQVTEYVGLTIRKVPRKLRDEFLGKVRATGKSMQDKIIELMEHYVNQK